MNITPEDLNKILSPTYEGDHYLACSMLRQSADEIDVALTILNRCAEDDDERKALSLLLAVVERMRFAAQVADAGAEGHQ
ncbi:MAG: hypothetical protein WDO74_10890 [Pseudomonadota bacterium]